LKWGGWSCFWIGVDRHGEFNGGPGLARYTVSTGLFMTGGPFTPNDEKSEGHGCVVGQAFSLRGAFSPAPDSTG